MSDPHIIALKRPVGPRGQEITELRLREPTAGEVMRASKETGHGLALTLLTAVTGAPADAIAALPGRVSEKALGYLMQFVSPVLADKAEVAEELPEELTITLAQTLQLGTTWVTELTLHEPTLSELIKVEKLDGFQRVLHLVALASGQSRIVIEALPISDYAKAAEYVMPFLFGARETGN